jgi:hypothetical protein
VSALKVALVNMAEVKSFTSFEEAVQFIRQHEETTETRYVVVKRRKGCKWPNAVY